MTELDRLRLEKARLQARCAVLMQGMAWMAKTVYADRAQAWVKAADKAGADVRLEDLVVANELSFIRSRIEDEPLNHPAVPES